MTAHDIDILVREGRAVDLFGHEPGNIGSLLVPPACFADEGQDVARYALQGRRARGSRSAVPALNQPALARPRGSRKRFVRLTNRPAGGH